MWLAWQVGKKNVIAGCCIIKIFVLCSTHLKDILKYRNTSTFNSSFQNYHMVLPHGATTWCKLHLIDILLLYKKESNSFRTWKKKSILWLAWKKRVRFAIFVQMGSVKREIVIFDAHLWSFIVYAWFVYLWKHFLYYEIPLQCIIV